MKMTKILGLAALGALLAVAAPTERAQAVSLSSPGAAAAVQDDAKQATTDVHYRRGPHRHYVPRHYVRPHRWHHPHRAYHHHRRHHWHR